MTISAELVIAGDTQPTTVRMAWPEGRKLDGPEWTVQRRGTPRDTVDDQPHRGSLRGSPRKPMTTPS